MHDLSSRCITWLHSFSSEVSHLSLRPSSSIKKGITELPAVPSNLSHLIHNTKQMHILLLSFSVQDQVILLQQSQRQTQLVPVSSKIGAVILRNLLTHQAVRRQRKKQTIVWMSPYLCPFACNPKLLVLLMQADLSRVLSRRFHIAMMLAHRAGCFLWQHGGQQFQLLSPSKCSPS